MTDAQRPLLDLDYFTGIKNYRGLVAMTFIQNAMPYLAGDTAGFTPQQALEMYRQGQAVIHVAEGQDLPVPTAPAPTKESPSAETARLNAIEVGPAIFAEHELNQISLAKKVANSDASITLEEAQRILRAELARREKATTPLAAVTSQSAPRGRRTTQETA